MISQYREKQYDEFLNEDLLNQEKIDFDSHQVNMN